MDGVPPHARGNSEPGNGITRRPRTLMPDQHPARIEDSGFLSDTQSSALVSRDGCVDWLCLPRFDSPACFASLLGEAKNGHWRFFPDAEKVDIRRRYRGDTLILETEMRTENGAVRLIDF